LAERAPAVAARLVEIWDEAFGTPWKAPQALARLFERAADTPELFARILDDIAAPDRDRASADAAFELIAACTRRRDDACAALVARARADRGLPWQVATWRYWTHRALARLDSPQAIATALLEFAEPWSVNDCVPLLRVLARDASFGLPVLERVVDMPKLAIEAVRALRDG